MSSPYANVKSAFSDVETKRAGDFLEFINASPSQFHAVETTVKSLVAAGFAQVSERDAKWNVLPGGKYFYTRNQSSVVAFIVGMKWQPGNGFTISAAHTDSPVLKVKPVSKVSKNGYLEVGVEPYGGGLWHTWFDRDLTVAGRVMIASGGDYVMKLVHIKRPILRIPTLAIHLNREVNDKGFIFNKQTHMLPVIATNVAEQLNGARKDSPMSNDHHPLLIELLAKELDVAPEDIRDFELSLTDMQPAGFGGAHNEFIFSRALDNLCMSHICSQALIASATSESINNEEKIRIVALFDHEECGSASVMGAASNGMYQLLNKLNADPASYDAAIAKSFLVSADMAHA